MKIRLLQLNIKGGMSMKKIGVAFLCIAFILALGACGSTNNNSDSNNNQPVSEGMEDNNSNSETNDENEKTLNDDEKEEKMKDIGMTEFELEVEYADGEYEAEIEKSSSGAYEAELEDELDNNNLKGDEAFNHIYDLVKNVDINPDSNENEVYEEFLNAFDLEDDYDEIEVEITFDDGSEVEYEE